MTTTTILPNTTDIRDLAGVTYHLGGTPSVLNVGDQMHDAAGNRYRVTRITSSPESYSDGTLSPHHRWDAHVHVTMRDGHQYDDVTTPGTLLDQIHNRTLLRYPTPAGLSFIRI